MSAPLQILITGCSDGGIGSALALRLADNKEPRCHVFATLRTPSKAASLANHPNITLLPLDVSSSTSLTTLTTTLSSQSITLDILICNAGAHHPGPLLDISIPEARDTYDANVWGYLAVVQALLPGMCKRGKGGLVVAVSSIAEIVPTPWAGIYSSSKAAMSIMAETLSMELEPFGIQSILIKPGAVISNIATTGHDRLPPSLTSPTSTSLYLPYLPSILARLTASQTHPSAITSTAAAELIATRIFSGFRAAGTAITWAEAVRAWAGFASRVEGGRNRWRGGVFLFGRLAWLFWGLKILAPRQWGLRFVSGQTTRPVKGGEGKKKD